MDFNSARLHQRADRPSGFTNEIASTLKGEAA